MLLQTEHVSKEFNGIYALRGASCEIGNTDFHLQPKGIFGCICKLTKLSGETPPGKA